MVDVNDSGRVYKVHLFVHFAKAHQIFVMIILYGIAVFVDGAAKHHMSQRVAAGFHFITPVYKVVRMLRSINGIEHNRKITAGRVLHAGGDVKAAYGEPVLLVFHGAGADRDIGEQIFDIAPVFRVEHFVCTG